MVTDKKECRHGIQDLEGHVFRGEKTNCHRRQGKGGFPAIVLRRGLYRGGRCSASEIMTLNQMRTDEAIHWARHLCRLEGFLQLLVQSDRRIAPPWMDCCPRTDRGRNLSRPLPEKWFSPVEIWRSEETARALYHKAVCTCKVTKLLMKASIRGKTIDRLIVRGHVPIPLGKTGAHWLNFFSNLDSHY